MPAAERTQVAGNAPYPVRAHRAQTVLLIKHGVGQATVTVLSIVEHVIGRFKNHDIGIEHLVVFVHVEDIHVRMDAFRARELVIQNRSLRIEVAALEHEQVQAVVVACQHLHLVHARHAAHASADGSYVRPVLPVPCAAWHRLEVLGMRHRLHL